MLADIPDLLLRPLLVLLLLGVAGSLIHLTTAHALGMQLAAGSGTSLSALGGFQPGRRQRWQRTATPDHPQRTWLISALPFLGIAVLNMLESQVSELPGRLSGRTGTGGLVTGSKPACGSDRYRSGRG